MASTALPLGNPAQPGPVHRLTFEYEGDHISLASDQVVTMIAPESHPLDEIGTRPGFSTVLRDAGDRALYQFTRSSPIRRDAEVFDGPANTLRRAPVEPPHLGTFVTLVPKVDDEASVEPLNVSLSSGSRAVAKPGEISAHTPEASG